MNDKKKGILWILGAAFFFALMNLFVKLGGDLPTMQKAFFRNAVATLPALVIVLRDKRNFSGVRKNLPGLLMRSAFGLFGILCNFYAIDRLNISDASLLNKMSPFFAVIFSALILKEIASKRDWLFVAAAFVGSLFVIKPTFSVEVVPALAGLAGGACAGLAYTYVRKLGMASVQGPMIVLFFSAFSSLALLPNLIINYVPMTAAQTVALLMAGVSAAGGQFCITTAYQKAPAKEISVFDYTQVVIAALLGFAFLHQMPDWLSVIGYIIILAVTVLKWQSNLKNA